MSEVDTLGRKRTKAEALERLAESRQVTGRVPLKGKPKVVRDLAYAGAMGLIMLDPFNRLADEQIVLPIDMVCIPAYQAYMIQGTPSLQIYVRAGETIVPTGGNVRDVEEAMEEVALASMSPDPRKAMAKSQRKSTPYQRAYKKAFASLAPKYKLKNGKWRKGGFKACVRASHKKAGGAK